jgi:hypothetical protein
MDSARVEPAGGSTDWLLLVRAKPRRAALAAALGDTASARQLYDEFLMLWRDPDAGLVRERDEVAQARSRLDGSGER